jgi:MFS family permease
MLNYKRMTQLRNRSMLWIQNWGSGDLFRALRHRNYRLFLVGQLMSQTGTWMQTVAQSWLVYRLTESPFLLGLVSFLSLAPLVPFTFVAGTLTDRYPRHRLILVTECVKMGQVLILAALAWFNRVEVWHIIVLSFIFGVAAALEQPARLTFVSDVVGEADLNNAIALNASIYNLARIAGPALTGIVILWAGEAGCFSASAATYVVFICLLSIMRLPPQKQREQKKIDLAHSWISALAYIRETPLIPGLFIMVATASFFLLPYLTMMPIFAQDVLQVGPNGLGNLMAASGLGAVIGAMIVASISEGRRGRWLNLSNIMGSILLICFSLSRLYLLSIVLVILVSINNAVRQTFSNSLLQINASEAYRGRVMSIFFLLFSGMSQVGTLAVGGLATFFSTQTVVGVFALLNLALACLIVTRLPHLYRLR